jgi:CMP-N,N'-diacetyllegionaminic acid synthase
MSNLAVIPARAGSKRLPGKNWRTFSGMPLVYWTIKAAIEAKSIDRVIVSTDSIEIMKMAIEHGAEVPFLRPAWLAKDSSSTHDVIINLLDELKLSEDYVPEKVITLQPTSPLRLSSDIDLAMEIFQHTRNADSLVSYAILPKSLHPDKIMTKKSDGFLQYRIGNNGNLQGMLTNEPLVIRNGAAIYISKNKNIKAGILVGNILGYEMPWSRSVDIDTLEDFIVAEAIFTHKNLKNS